MLVAHTPTYSFILYFLSIGTNIIYTMIILNKANFSFVYSCAPTATQFISHFLGIFFSIHNLSSLFSLHKCIMDKIIIFFVHCFVWLFFCVFVCLFHISHLPFISSLPMSRNGCYNKWVGCYHIHSRMYRYYVRSLEEYRVEHLLISDY